MDFSNTERGEHRPNPTVLSLGKNLTRKQSGVSNLSLRELQDVVERLPRRYGERGTKVPAPDLLQHRLAALVRDKIHLLVLMGSVPCIAVAAIRQGRRR